VNGNEKDIFQLLQQKRNPSWLCSHEFLKYFEFLMGYLVTFGISRLVIVLHKQFDVEYYLQ